MDLMVDLPTQVGNTRDMTNTHNTKEGSLYASSEDMSIKEITAHIRQTIRQFVKDAMISEKFTYSVRMQTFAHGHKQINIEIGVPSDLIEMRFDYEEMLWKNDLTPDYLVENCLMTGNFEPLNELRSTVLMVKELHDGYNFLSIPINPFEDGCAFRYGGRVEVRSL